MGGGEAGDLIRATCAESPLPLWERVDRRDSGETGEGLLPRAQLSQLRLRRNTPHPALRATFSKASADMRGEGKTAAQVSKTPHLGLGLCPPQIIHRGIRLL